MAKTTTTTTAAAKASDTAVSAYRYAKGLLADGAKRGLRDRALAEIGRLAGDTSVHADARAAYAAIYELETADFD